MAVALRLAHAALREAAPSVTDVATFDAELRRRGEAAAGTGNGGEDDEDVDDQAVRGNEKLVAWRRRHAGVSTSAGTGTAARHRCGRQCKFEALGTNRWGCVARCVPCRELAAPSAIAPRVVCADAFPPFSSGRVHVCSLTRDACRLAEPDSAGLLVCPASGRSFANLVGRIDDGLMVEEGAREEVGRLRDVFEGGYYAETEAALLG